MCSTEIRSVDLTGVEMAEFWQKQKRDHTGVYPPAIVPFYYQRSLQCHGNRMAGNRYWRSAQPACIRNWNKNAGCTNVFERGCRIAWTVIRVLDQLCI